MRILVVGSGGREHALTWAMQRSPSHPDLFIAPGNPGTATLGTNVSLAADDIEGLLAFAKKESIDLTIVGPEKPLVDGIVDRFNEAGLAIVGPTAKAAQLEGSKAFAKSFMARHGIPTAAYKTFARDAYAEAKAYLEAQGVPIVIKASGLAAGKGAVVCTQEEEALATLTAMMKEGGFGGAADQVVIESFMEGEEASVFALCDGKDYIVLPTAQDHKQVGEGDQGPNTGGMGAYAPAPIMTPALLEETCRTIIEPTLFGMAAEGHPYQGFLYCGLMITKEGPQVVEFNCRMGDPETQAVMPLLQDDLVDIFIHTHQGRLSDVHLKPFQGAAACVVLASGGYPGSYTKGHPISGLDTSLNSTDKVIFHAGTRHNENHVLCTHGGRVLGVTSKADDLSQALEMVYNMIDAIHFEGMYYRRDIGQKGLRHRT